MAKADAGGGAGQSLTLNELLTALIDKAPSGALLSIVNALETRQQLDADLDYRRRAVRSLVPDRLRHLDIGARGEPRRHIANLQSCFELFTVEPDPDAAAALRAAGHTVIERAMADIAGERRDLHLTRKPGLSSLLPPTEAMPAFYARGAGTFAVTGIATVETTTIDEETARLGHGFDDVKIDVQGGELLVLRGMNRVRPFVLDVEVSTVAFYRGQGLFHEISAHLYGLGYLLGDLSLIRSNGMPSATAFLPDGRRPARGLPLHGDACFLPDWTRDAGVALIEQAPRRWAATLLAHGYEDIVRYVCAHTEADWTAPILAALDGDG